MIGWSCATLNSWKYHHMSFRCLRICNCAFSVGYHFHLYILTFKRMFGSFAFVIQYWKFESSGNVIQFYFNNWKRFGNIKIRQSYNLNCYLAKIETFFLKAVLVISKWSFLSICVFFQIAQRLAIFEFSGFMQTLFLQEFYPFLWSLI